MKYIVIGLGYFGSTLASNLTRQGHEVIGVDKRAEKIDELKESISIVMELDSTNQNAVKTLPIQDVDAIIVAIGEDIGSSILTLTILKNLDANRIIGRAITPLHRNILTQIGIKEIVQPEEDSALLVSSMLQIKNAKRVIELNEESSIAEIMVPTKYIGHNLDSVNIESRFNLKLIAVKIFLKERMLDVFNTSECKISFELDKERPLRETDVLVLAGSVDDIKKFIES
ncbi:MAG TPA: potassium transporter TrkA [Bacteroidales bacterium]|jgi:trk system potassium uptake protein TrkA|nr:potassium transporter TrkA [Bacteroidales bacterium]